MVLPGNPGSPAAPVGPGRPRGPAGPGRPAGPGGPGIDTVSVPTKKNKQEEHHLHPTQKSISVLLNRLNVSLLLGAMTLPGDPGSPGKKNR